MLRLSASPRPIRTTSFQFRSRQCSIPSLRALHLSAISKMASPTDQWNSRYNTEIFQYGTAPNDFLAAQTARLANAKSILCLAEGEGRNALHILKNVPGARVVCVDLSAIGLDKAKKLFLKEGIDESRFETVVADLAEYDIGSGKWEAIVSIWCHVPEGMRKGLHARCVEGLKSGGVFILEAYTPKQ